jgi:hypothetical protein
VQLPARALLSVGAVRSAGGGFEESAARVSRALAAFCVSGFGNDRFERLLTVPVGHGFLARIASAIPFVGGCLASPPHVSATTRGLGSSYLVVMVSPGSPPLSRLSGRFTGTSR